MSKELEALTKIKEHLTRYDDTDDIRGIDYENEVNIIETALKDYEKKTKLEIENHYLEHDNFLLKGENKELRKALEIIKEKMPNVKAFKVFVNENKNYCAKDWNYRYPNMPLTVEEYDLLKEVLL